MVPFVRWCQRRSKIERPPFEVAALGAFSPSWTLSVEARIPNASTREAGVDGGVGVIFRKCVEAYTQTCRAEYRCSHYCHGVIGRRFLGIRRIRILSIRTKRIGALRGRSNRRDRPGLDADLASVRIKSHCEVTGTDHDGVPDLGFDRAVYRLEALALIEIEIALDWFDLGAPARATNEQKTTQAKSPKLGSNTHCPHSP